MRTASKEETLRKTLQPGQLRNLTELGVKNLKMDETGVKWIQTTPVKTTTYRPPMSAN